jgi:outer membrane lipoprotein carrier protein
MTRRAVVALSTLVCSYALAQEPIPPGMKGADRLAALVQRVSQVQASTATLTAKFELRRTSHLLAAPSVSQGRFYYRGPDSVRWEYEMPRPMTVVISGGVAITYRPAERRAERVEVGRAQRRVFRFMSASEPLEKLKQYFSFTFRDPGPSGNYTLELKPTSHQIKKRLRSVELEIQRQTLIPVRVAYTEADGDRTEYVFSDIEVNAKQAADLYELVLPPDVEVVKIKVGSGE